MRDLQNDKILKTPAEPAFDPGSTNGAGAGRVADLIVLLLPCVLRTEVMGFFVAF